MNDQILVNLDSNLPRSAIWSSEIRDDVTKKKLSMHELNEMRSDKLVPGLKIELMDETVNDLPAVPILFIQDPGEDNETKPLGNFQLFYYSMKCTTHLFILPEYVRHH